MRKGNRQERKERTEDSFELVAGARAYPALAPAGLVLEAKFQPQLHDAGASRSEDRIAVDDIRRAASAAERMGNRGVVPDVGAHHATVGIGEVGVIKDVKELDAEFSAEPLLELEVLEYGEVEVPESRVTEEPPSHRAKRSELWRNHHRVAPYVAATRSQGGRVWGDSQTLRTE
jgi:hypothetical protein